MNLSFHKDINSRTYPTGYWYAVTDDGGYDADGATPLDAVSELVAVLEAEVSRRDAPTP